MICFIPQVREKADEEEHEIRSKTLQESSYTIMKVQQQQQWRSDRNKSESADLDTWFCMGEVKMGKGRACSLAWVTKSVGGDMRVISVWDMLRLKCLKQT